MLLMEWLNSPNILPITWTRKMKHPCLLRSYTRTCKVGCKVTIIWPSTLYNLFLNSSENLRSSSWFKDDLQDDGLRRRRKSVEGRIRQNLYCRSKNFKSVNTSWNVSFVILLKKKFIKIFSDTVTFNEWRKMPKCCWRALSSFNINNNAMCIYSCMMTKFIYMYLCFYPISFHYFCYGNFIC